MSISQDSRNTSVNTASNSGAAVFFDRDGVINRRLVGDYVRNPAEFELLPGVIEVLQLADKRGYKLVVVTNQQGVGKGIMSLSDLLRVHRHMQSLLAQACGLKFDLMFACTTLASNPANARKPQPHMLQLAMRRWGLNAEKCWMIGDSTSDIYAGRAAGVSTIGVHMYEPLEAVRTAGPDYLCADLGELHTVLNRVL